jgi:imidazolonepropionase
MSLVVSLAITHFGMSVAEALRAATLGGAQALRSPELGTMAPGRYADIVAWDADHEGAFAWSYGLPRCASGAVASPSWPEHLPRKRRGRPVR